jgi:hypothetical protein
MTRLLLSQILATLSICVALTSCAGFRGGWESVPYVGDVSPPPTAAEPQLSGQAPDPAELVLPGLKLRITIDNQLRTYDTKIYFGLPLSIDPRGVYAKNHEPGKTRVFVSVTPDAAGFVFRPSAARLEIEGKRYMAGAGYRFGMWDEQGRLVDKDGKWDHRAIDGEMLLDRPGTRYFLSLRFDVPTPSPESRSTTLDLSDALRDPALAPLPLIRFAPVRWKEGYT